MNDTTTYFYRSTKKNHGESLVGIRVSKLGHVGIVVAACLVAAAVAGSALVMAGNLYSPSAPGTSHCAASTDYMPIAQQNSILWNLKEPSARWMVEYRESDGYIMGMGIWHPGDLEITTTDGTAMLDATTDPNLASFICATLSPDPLPWKVDTQTLQLEPN